MPRTTLNDRARKSRIRERELMQLRRYELKLNALGDAEFKELCATLEKLDKAETDDKPFTVETFPQWKELSKLGVAFKTRDGKVLVSSIGRDIMEAGAEE